MASRAAEKWWQLASAGHKQVVDGKSQTTLGSVVPFTVKIPNLGFRAMTSDAHSWTVNRIGLSSVDEDAGDDCAALPSIAEDDNELPWEEADEGEAQLASKVD